MKKKNPNLLLSLRSCREWHLPLFRFPNPNFPIIWKMAPPPLEKHEEKKEEKTSSQLHVTPKCNTAREISRFHGTKNAIYAYNEKY